MNRKSLPFLFALSLAGLAGCAAKPAASPAQDALSSDSALSGGASCDAQSAQSWLGQPFTDSSSADVRKRSGSDTVRVLKPGQVMTLEYNPGRVNIIVDGQGKISAIRCG
ncbi:I78 family peptidase inhibitor [Bordetella avium]|uniref:Lipoprotein n=1 Tax=Bordetella avium (strain 197N) TaxID=360910 RepID=Q2L1M1_BORA1|nr:I78 family peptidase inhibitor [Bordetella avium]AZY49000.1 hypothetical protein C0J09_07500 [Bordetella avium]AZY52360.1 hypothetical protein C0J07_07475 [Bordetella avium]RIQ14244.1 hypothetical protein D0432_08350 [Bordetella avium]RIQ18118.1 hypothetical protein D0850_08285 [Bordetella avium]RIQ36590.1 hypothetical protein D0849_02760 [Bordetella avium]